MKCEFHFLNIVQLFFALVILQWGGFLIGLTGVPMILLLGLFGYLFFDLVGPILTVSWIEDDSD